MDTLDKVIRRSRGAAEFAEGYLGYLCGVLKSLDAKAIGETAKVLERARKQGRKIFIIGNGGSAATASHMANDLGIGCKCGSNRRFQAISLTDNVAVMTAIANDTSYENLFVGQLEVLLQPKDVVVAISASGNSPNVVNAVRYAKRKGAVTIGFTGFDGGKLKKACDHVVWARTPKGEYGPVEDVHMVLDHLLMTYLKAAIKRSC